SERNLKVGVRSLLRFSGRLVKVVCGGSVSPPPPPPPPQAVSVGVAELGRGVRDVTAKSALLLLVSSGGSSRVAQPRAIVRGSELPAGMAGAAVPTFRPAMLPPLLKLPKETQSISNSSKQIAPPTPAKAISLDIPEIVKSRPGTPVSPMRIVRCESPLAGSG